MQCVASANAARSIEREQSGAVEVGGFNGQQSQVVGDEALKPPPCSVRPMTSSDAMRCFRPSALPNSVTHHAADTRSPWVAAYQAATPTLLGSLTISATSTLVLT